MKTSHKYHILPKRILFGVFTSIPTKEFVKQKILPLFALNDFSDGSVIIFCTDIKEKLAKIGDEMHYNAFIRNKIKEGKMLPITILRHYLNFFDYSVVVKQFVRYGRHQRSYSIINLSNYKYELKNDKIVITFD